MPRESLTKAQLDCWLRAREEHEWRYQRLLRRSLDAVYEQVGGGHFITKSALARSLGVQRKDIEEVYRRCPELPKLIAQHAHFVGKKESTMHTYLHSPSIAPAASGAMREPQPA